MITFTTINRHNNKVNHCRRWMARRLDYIIDGDEVPEKLSTENFTKIKSERWGKRAFGVCGFRAKRMAMDSKRTAEAKRVCSWPNRERIQRNEVMHPCAIPMTALSAEHLMVATQDYRIHVLDAEPEEPAWMGSFLRLLNGVDA